MEAHQVMSQLSGALWYLSLPLLVYVSWRFVRLNVSQCERLERQGGGVEGEG